MKPTLVVLMVLAALTYGSPQKTPEARKAESGNSAENSKIR